MPSANDELADRAVRHAHFIERFKTGEANDIIALYNANVLPGLSRTAIRAIETAQMRPTKANIAAMQRAILKGKTMQSLISRLERDMGALSIQEKNHILRVIGGSTPVNLDLQSPSNATMRELAINEPMRGAPMADWLESLDVNSRVELNRQLVQGIADGESIPQLVGRLTGKGGVADLTRNNIEAIVRTATSNVVNKARERVYVENEDVIKGVEYIATLDSRTTPICASLDGKIFPVGEGPRPPQNWNCRSSTAAVLKSWKELGIKLDEAPPGTRASLNGQVSDDIKYNDWLKGQIKKDFSVVEKALGPTRARLFRQGKISADQLVTKKGVPMTLKELKSAEGLTDKDIKVSRTVEE